MAILKSQRGAQYPLFKEFVFNYNDTAVDSVALASKSFGSNFNDNIVFDGISLPVGAVIVGGELIVETAFVGPTAATVQAGIAGNTAAYLAATSLLATGRTPLLLTSPLLSNGGADVRLTLATTVANATAGKARVRIQYTLDNRVQEVSAS